MLSACVGRFETKTTITATCRLDPERHSRFVAAIPPDNSISKGLRVLVWNIHDRLLPDTTFPSAGHSEEEMACIGELASRFDLVLLQEAFVRPEQLARYTGHTWADHPVFPEGGGGDWWPWRWMCEICRSPGLLMLAQEQPMSVFSEPYEAFAGWNTDLNKADDFFSKGFQLVQFPSFWVVNSHMDAGRGQASIDARAQQLRQMTMVAKRLVPRDAPLLIGMDANLRPDVEEQDENMLREFLQANGLTIVHHHGPDLIAVRSIFVEHHQSLPLKDILSDHHALSVILQLYDAPTLKPSIP